MSVEGSIISESDSIALTYWMSINYLFIYLLLYTMNQTMIIPILYKSESSTCMVWSKETVKKEYIGKYGYKKTYQQYNSCLGRIDTYTNNGNDILDTIGATIIFTLIGFIVYIIYKIVSFK